METFKKSQLYLEEANERLLEYPVLLMKMSSLFLNSGDIYSCVEYGNKSLLESEGLEVK